MTTTPDPKTVRDFARRAILSSAEDVDYMGIGEAFGEDESWPQGDGLAYDAMHDAVYNAVGAATVTVSWPDEQPQDAVPLTADELAELTASIEHLSGPDAWDEDRLEPALIPVMRYMRRVLAAQAGQPQDDGDVRAVAMRAFLDLHAERRGHDLIASLAVGDGRTLELTRSGLNRLLDEKKRLAARIAELERRPDPIGTYYPEAEAFTAREAQRQREFERRDTADGGGDRG